MKKGFIFGLCMIMIAGMLCACGVPQEGVDRIPRYSYMDLYGDDYDYIYDEGGYYEGVMGDVMENLFFSYCVDDARFVDSYAGYEPDDGYVLLDVIISVTNTFIEGIPMYDTDFQIQWGGEDDAYGYGLSELAEFDPEVMPEEFWLEEDESVQYHVIYEVPEGCTEFSVSYLELFDDGTEGDVYFVYFEVEPDWV